MRSESANRSNLGLILTACSFVLLLSASPARAQDCSGGLFFVSTAVVAGSAIYDIATASKSARRYNATHLSVAPLVNPRNGSYGLMASLPLGRSRRAPQPQAPAHKSPSTAFQLSLFSTVIPMGAGAAGLASSDTDAAGAFVFLGGLVIGPSVGHFYAGQGGRGIGTTLLRAGVTVLGIASVVPCIGD